MDNEIKIYVDKDSEDRLDLFISEEWEGISRAAVQKLIRNGNVTDNGT